MEQFCFHFPKKEVNLARGIRITEFLKNFASGTILSHSAPFEQNKIIAMVLFEDSHNFIWWHTELIRLHQLSPIGFQ